MHDQRSTPRVPRKIRKRRLIALGSRFFFKASSWQPGEPSLEIVVFAEAFRKVSRCCCNPHYGKRRALSG